MAKNLVMDRTRLLAALPHARDTGHLGKWALLFAWGKLTNDVVPVSGGTIALRGRTLVTNAWGKSYAASNSVSLALLSVSMLYGIPNLYDGYQKDGFDGLVTTRPGRTGVIGAAMGATYLALFAAAFVSLPKGGRSVSAMLRVAWLSDTRIVFGMAALGSPGIANELGLLDVLNRTSSSRAVTASTERGPTPTASDPGPVSSGD